MDSTTGWPAGWRGGNLGKGGTVCGHTPTGGSNGGSGTAVCGDLCILPPEHSRKVYCENAHCGPVSGGREETRSTVIQTVVGTGRGRCGEYADRSLVGRTDRGGGGTGRKQIRTTN